MVSWQAGQNDLEDSAHTSVSYLGRNLEEKVILHIARRPLVVAVASHRGR